MINRSPLFPLKGAYGKCLTPVLLFPSSDETINSNHFAIATCPFNQDMDRISPFYHESKKVWNAIKRVPDTYPTWIYSGGQKKVIERLIAPREIIKIEWKGCGQQLRPTCKDRGKDLHRRRPRRRMPDHARKKTKSSFYDSWKDNTDYTRRIRSGSLESNLNFFLRPFDNTVFTLRHQPKQRQATPSICMMGWWFLLVEMNWRIGK